MELHKNDRELIFQDNLESYYSSRKRILSEEKYNELLGVINEEMIRDNLDADLQGDIIDLDVSDIIDKPVEYLKLFCFDENKRCYHGEIVAIGDEDTVQFDYFQIARILIEQDAKYFSFIHNHAIAYGAKFSKSDLNMAFNVARLGEGLGVYILDFAVVTKYDAIKLSSDSKLYDEICDFQESDSQFYQQSLLLSSEPLYIYLNSIKNKRRLEQCSFNYQYIPTSEQDLNQTVELLQRLLAHCHDDTLKHEILEKFKKVIQEWE